MEKLLNDIPNPPEAEAGHYAEWDGSKWVIKPIPEPKYIPQRPVVPEGYETEWDGNQWIVKKITIQPYQEPTELQKAEWYLQCTAWIFVDGIVDLYKNAAEIKAARAAAIEVMKAHKAELAMEAPDFN